MRPKVGDLVLYTIHGRGREEAKVVELIGSTYAKFRILTGSHAGKEVEDVPWGILPAEFESSGKSKG
jgi:hypothetical protein